MLGKSKSRLIWSGILAGAIACAGTALAAGTATVSGNVAGWVKNATLKSSAPASTTVTISVNLALKNLAGLKSFVAEVSNPASREYGKYLSTEQFAASYAPAAADVAAVEKFLEQSGMKDVAVGPHGVYVSATATVAQIRTAFNVSQNLYAYQGFTLRANKEEPSVPAALAGKIAFIGGLDDTGLMRKPFHRSIMQGDLVAPKSAAGRLDEHHRRDAAAGRRIERLAVLQPHLRRGRAGRDAEHVRGRVWILDPLAGMRL